MCMLIFFKFLNFACDHTHINFTTRLFVRKLDETLKLCKFNDHAFILVYRSHRRYCLTIFMRRRIECNESNGKKYTTPCTETGIEDYLRWNVMTVAAYCFFSFVSNSSEVDRVIETQPQIKIHVSFGLIVLINSSVVDVAVRVSFSCLPFDHRRVSPDRYRATMLWQPIHYLVSRNQNKPPGDPFVILLKLFLIRLLSPFNGKRQLMGLGDQTFPRDVYQDTSVRQI